jgi:hypothetical protein
VFFSRESDEQREARRVRGTTRHHDIAVPVDEALALLKSAAERRSPMMRLVTYTADSATVAVSGSIGGPLGTGGSLGAAASATGRLSVGIKLTWAPHEDGTRYTAHASSIGAMYLLRTDIYSIWRALDDAEFARERGW